MKTKVLSRISAVTACLFLALTGARGVPVSMDVGLTDPNAVGDVINGIQAGGQVARDVLMVNNLITVPLSTSQTIGGELYERSGNNFGSLPSATATGAVWAIPGGGSGALPINFLTTTVELTMSTPFTYLVAAYDGPNGGVEVWDVGAYAAGTTFSIPRYAYPANPGNPDVGPLVNGATAAKYQMTGWSLLNPTTSVPDGGTTVLLLGSALAGLGAISRKFKK